MGVTTLAVEAGVGVAAFFGVGDGLTAWLGVGETAVDTVGVGEGLGNDVSVGTACEGVGLAVVEEPLKRLQLEAPSATRAIAVTTLVRVARLAPLTAS